MSEPTKAFVIITRNKARFPYRGMLSVEELWDLGEKALDLIYRNLRKESKADEDSLLETEDLDEVAQAQIEVVRYIFEVKRAEKLEAKQATEKAAKKQKLLGILAEKQDEGLRGMSEEDLQKMIEEL